MIDELRVEAINHKQTDTVVYMLILGIDEAERKLHEDEKDNSLNVNIIGAVDRFFKRGTK